MTKSQKCQAIVERLLELSESGVQVTFSEHMDETVIDWGRDRKPESHSHVFYHNGELGKINSVLKILSSIGIDEDVSDE